MNDLSVCFGGPESQTEASIVKGWKTTDSLGNYVVTWKKQDNGEWKLYRDIGVSSMPAASK